MALALTFIVTNEDGFGRRETLPWGRMKPTGLLGVLQSLEKVVISVPASVPPSPCFSRPRGTIGTRTDWGP